MRVCPSCRALYLNNEPFCSKDGTATSLMEDQSNRSLVGTQIGNYQVTALLGEGGMGKVYRAEHPSLGRVVAIKVLHEEYAKKVNAVERFFLEAKTVNQIGHENIVDVLDFGSLSDGSPYYVMAYLEGLSLSALLKQRGALPLDEVQAIILPVLSALQAAHEEGIIHRDLKPDNIFLANRRRGPRQVKLLDFGIAKLLDTTATNFKTSTGAVIGTPAFMAPEQIQSLPDIDGRADIYAAGVLLFQMFTGQIPFSGNNAIDVLQKHVLQEPPSAKTLRPDLPDALNSLVLRALAKQPGDRFPSARAFAEALQAAFTAHGLPPLLLDVASSSEWVAVGARPSPANRQETTQHESGDLEALRSEPTRANAQRPVDPNVALSRTTLTSSTGELTPPGSREYPALRRPRWTIPAVAAVLGALGAGVFFLQSEGPTTPKPLASSASSVPASMPAPASVPASAPESVPASAPVDVPGPAAVPAPVVAGKGNKPAPLPTKPKGKDGLDKITPKIRKLKDKK